MVENTRRFRVINQLPGEMGAIMVQGVTFKPTELLPQDAPPKVLEDYLNRELVEIVGTEVTENETHKIDPEWRKRLRPISKWNINPGDLVGKTLVELNIMILEKDPNSEPFDSMNEAVNQLTKDYEG